MSSELKQILENHKELIVITEHLDELSKELSDRDWSVALTATAYLEQLLEVVIKTNEIMEVLIPISNMSKVPRLRIVRDRLVRE